MPLRLGPDAPAGSLGASVREDIERLGHIAVELADIAQRIKRMIPAHHDRDDLILEAFTRIGGASAEVERAKRALLLAIRKELGQ